MRRSKQRGQFANQIVNILFWVVVVGAILFFVGIYIVKNGGSLVSGVGSIKP